MIRYMISVALFTIITPELANCKLNETSINITYGYHDTLDFNYNSSVDTYSIYLNPTGGCIIYLTVEYDNADVHIDMTDTIMYNRSNNSNPVGKKLPSTMKRIEIPPRPMPMTVSLDDTNNYVRNSTVSLIITTDRVNTSAPEIQLNVGEGYLYDASKTVANTTTKVSLATVNSSSSRLLLFFQCDESRVAKNHDDLTPYCCSILFYRENGYQGCLKTFAGYGYNKYLPMDPVTSFTVYQKYIPQMFAQIYFYAPQIDFRYFLYNYGLALPNDLIFNIAFDQYNTVFSLARFLATVHFVNFQGTNQKRLNYVQLNRGATLLVYKGIPEIVGYDFPNKDLVAKITENGTVSGMSLTSSPVYTFVAVNDNVYYEFAEDDIFEGANSKNRISSINVFIVLTIICTFLLR